MPPESGRGGWCGADGEGRPGLTAVHWKEQHTSIKEKQALGSTQASAGLMQRTKGMGWTRSDASSLSHLRHPPPSMGPRMGYAGRNSDTEPTPTSRSTGRQGLKSEARWMPETRGSKGRWATVDCCSSDLSVPDGKQGTIFARGTPVSSFFSCVWRTESEQRVNPGGTAARVWGSDARSRLSLIRLDAKFGKY